MEIVAAMTIFTILFLFFVLALIRLYWPANVINVPFIALNVLRTRSRVGDIIKGSKLGAFCLYAILYCYLEFKLRYLKNLELFSIRVKELFESSFTKKGNGFLLFLKAFLEKPIFE